MNNSYCTLPHRQSLALILLPMIATVVIIRAYLHSFEIQHIYIGGHIFYHLFTGVLLVIPAAFILAFEPRRKAVTRLTRVVLGVGSGLVLDEIVFLVATNRTAEAYLTSLSLGGSIAFVSGASVLLVSIYLLMRDTRSGPE